MPQTGTTCKKLPGHSWNTEDLGIFDLQDQDSASDSSHAFLQSPQAGSFQESCLFHICLQSEAWMVSRFGFLYGCQESPSPQLPQGFEGLLLVQASTHFRRFSSLFLSPSATKLCPSQPESEEEQQGSIYFLELLPDSLKVLLPARTASEFYNKGFCVLWGFFLTF